MRNTIIVFPERYTPYASNAASVTILLRSEAGTQVQTIRTTRIAGGLLLGYNPWKAGARLKTPAFTLFRPYCP